MGYVAFGLTEDEVIIKLSDLGWITREIESFINWCKFNSIAKSGDVTLAYTNSYPHFAIAIAEERQS
jgi:hypothetical protein